MRALWAYLLLTALALGGARCVSGADGQARKMYPADLTLQPGQQGSVAVKLDAQGNEMLFSFVLAYDAAQFDYVTASLGSDAPGGSNFDPVAGSVPGMQGFAVYCPERVGVPAGTGRAILNVVLRAKDDATLGTYETSLVGDDSIIQLQVGDTALNNVTAETDFLTGHITLLYIPPPVLSSVTPDHGWANFNTAVTLSGTGFSTSPPATVLIGTRNAVSVTVVNSTCITCTAPAAPAGAAAVKVTNPDGRYSVLSPGYTCVAPPAVTGISPGHGPATLPSGVTLSGQDFAAGAAVTFGGLPATDVQVLGGTALTCTAPTSAPGTVPVRVTNPDAQISECSYTFDPAPQLVSLSPGEGPATMGTRVTLAGTGFVNGAVVRFDGLLSSGGVTFVDSAHVSCTTPLHAPGAVSVTLVNPDGQACALAGGFTYLPSGRWQTLANMHTERRMPTATLLSSGKVLVAGGSSSSGPAGYVSRAEVFDPATGAWSLTPAMLAPRASHSATRLPNGQTLVAGGLGALGTLTAAELYDPATASWVSGGALSQARESHTATLLANGAVLVAGGSAPSGASLLSAELYSSASGWSAAAGMSTRRTCHAATLLPNGKVLVSGGWDSEAHTALPHAELYDPAGAGTWTATGALNTPRLGHAAVLLPGGQVLAAGGWGADGTAVSSAELYDPAAGTWTATGSMGGARAQFTAALLPSGLVLVSGGAISGGYIAGAELYDPAAGLWTSTVDLGTARGSQAAVLLADGSVLVAGGAGVASYGLAGAERYDPSPGFFTSAGRLAVPLCDHTSVLLPDGTVLIAGGYTGVAASADAARYDPTRNAWSTTGALGVARYAHTATLLSNGKVLAAGGSDDAADLFSAELYDPAAGVWSLTARLNDPRSEHSATLLRSGQVLVAGGKVNGAPSSSAELYDPPSGSWTRTGALITGRRGHTAVCLPGGKVLVAGGYGAGNLAVTAAEIYDPATGLWAAAAPLGVARGEHSATLLPNGTVLLAGGYHQTSRALTAVETYDPAANAWTAQAALPEARYRHTATLLPSGRVLAAGGYGTTGLAGAAVYDPASSTWTPTAPLATARGWHTASVLPTGKILLTGGFGGPSYLPSAELYDPGLACLAEAQPAVSSATSPLPVGAAFTLAGAQFRGLSEAAGGSVNSSATNFPLVQIRSLVNEQTRFLDPGSAGWSDTAFTSGPQSGLPPGHALATVFSNAVPSVSRVILIWGPAPVVSAVSPGFSELRGGKQVTLTGAHFTPGATVAFNGAGAANAAVLNETSISCTTPALSSSGWLTVSVTNPDGQSGSLSGTFIYVMPEVWVDSNYPAVNEDTNGDALFRTLPAALQVVSAEGKVHVADGTYPENQLIDKKVTVFANVLGPSTAIGSLAFGGGATDAVVQPGTESAPGLLHIGAGANFSLGTPALRVRIAGTGAAGTGYDQLYSSGGGLRLGGSSKLLVDAAALGANGTGGAALPVAFFGQGVASAFNSFELLHADAQRLSALVSYDAQHVYVQVGQGLGTVASVTVNPVQVNGSSATATYGSVRSLYSAGTVYYNVWLRANGVWQNPQPWSTATSCTVPSLPDGTYQFYVEARTWRSGPRNAEAYGEYFYIGPFVNHVTVNAPSVNHAAGRALVTYSATGPNNPSPWFRVWLKDCGSGVWTTLTSWIPNTSTTATVSAAGTYQFWVEASARAGASQASAYGVPFEVRGAVGNLRITGQSAGLRTATITFAADETLPRAAYYQVYLRLPNGMWLLAQDWSQNTSLTMNALTSGQWYQFWVGVRAGRSGTWSEGVYGSYFRP